MSTVLSSRVMSETKRTTAIVLTGLLAIAGLTAIPSSASASTDYPVTIVFDTNTLGLTTPATETAFRASADSLRLSSESLARSTTTSRTGYSFGGWSLSRGAAATTEITTATTGDTTRTLFAVWNTMITYSKNGADSGNPFGNVLNETYRFGETLTLPTVGTMVKSGFAFGGWMPTTVSTIRSTTYTAAAAELGNPTL